MNFSTANKVSEVVYAMREADLARSANRAAINSLFNGDPIFTEEQKRASGMFTNVNFLDAARIAHDARSSWDNAMLKPGNCFSVGLDSGPVHKKSTWGREITKNINRPIKRSCAYTESVRSTGANVVLHGPGPVFWEDRHKWNPCAIGVEDLLVPSGTRLSFDNVNHFAIFREYTGAQLYRLTHGKQRDPGWNMGLVNKLLSKIADQNTQTNNDATTRIPEKIQEMYRSDLGYFQSDAVPTIKCWEFYFEDEESDKRTWKRRIVLDSDGEARGKEQFLYSPKRDYAQSLHEILHVQFADGANVAPFRYHSVRSLGFMLYAVGMLQNLLLCRFNDATLESFNWHFYANSADDRERVEKVDLYDRSIIPNGITFVPANERFQVRETLVQAALSQNRQRMSENSSSFTQDINDGTQKELTATEVMARTSAATALVSSMLNLAYTYQTTQYREICRRFCIKGSKDPDVKKFQEACLKDGVPREMLDVEKWDVEPERVLGSGNKQLEIAQAQQLMSIRQLLDPDAQREVDHIFVETMTDDPKLAERLTPMAKRPVTDTVHDAELASAALMMGLPVSIKTGHNHIEYIETLLRSISSVIARIEGTTKMATQAEIIGFQSVARHIGEHIQILAQDKNEKQRVKKYGDALGKLMNMVKAYAQRLQEQQAQDQAGAGGLPPEAMAKIQSATILAQTNAKIKEAKAAQQMMHKDTSFKAGEQRKNVQLQQDLQRQIAETQTDIAATDLTTQAEIIRQGRKPQKPLAS